MRIPNPFSPTDFRPPLWREAGVGLEAAALLRDPVFRCEGVADGGGQPVFLIPGFLAGDGSLAMMTRWLRRAGYHTRKAGLRSNVGCSGTAVERLEDRLEDLVEGRGRRAAIVGQSRGGTLAKVLAQRRPDLVRGIVTLGTPLRDPFAVHPLVSMQLVAVGALGTLGAPGLFRRACLNGSCCAEFWEQYSAPLRTGAGFVAVYSKTDGIVDWRSCLDPSARHVEVRASHIGMAVSAGAYRALADALESFRRLETRRREPPGRIPRAA